MRQDLEPAQDRAVTGADGVIVEPLVRGGVPDPDIGQHRGLVGVGLGGEDGARQPVDPRGRGIVERGEGGLVALAGQSQQVIEAGEAEVRRCGRGRRGRRRDRLVFRDGRTIGETGSVLLHGASSIGTLGHPALMPRGP
ncbi:hypothetical protein ACFFX0_07340 [Citricoccus parietis]|uniref:Uncharacterized protein n=1 Tax=Citricoccus parietis TaxID=592307 RepID=A0ABV5FWI0_9MICC